MLEGFKAIVDRDTLRIIDQRIRDIQVKLLKGIPLTKKEEKDLKHYLWGVDGLGRKFRDDNHRLKLIEQWLRDAKLHDKRLEEEEAKAKR
jgi:hypothetical protein